MGQPQVNLEQVINILRIRLHEEIYQRALLEAAYTQATQQIDQLTRDLNKARETAADQHTQLSQQLENGRAEWKSPVPETWKHPRTYPPKTDTTTPPQDPPQTDAEPADTSQTQHDTKSP